MVRKFERTAVLVVLVASPFWLPAIPAQLGGSVRSTISGWFEPGLRGAGSVRQGFGGLFTGLLDFLSVREENRLLRAQVQAFRAHEETHRDLAQENERLREMVRFREKAPWKLRPAEVIGRELGPWSRSILLDQGSDDGVRQGMAVIAPKGLVGRISEVGPSTSRAVLITDAHFRVTAVLSQKRVSGLVMGGGSGQCLLTYLPVDLEVEAGETAMTAGGKSFCPDGIPIGTIRRTWEDSSDMFRTARIEPAVPLGSVEEVLVVLSPPERE